MPTTIKSTEALPGLFEALNAARAHWERTYVRKLVKPTQMPAHSTEPVEFENLPQFPGSGTVRTCTPGETAVSIEGMPPSKYPENGPAIVMYTLASMICEDPRLALSRGDMNLLRVVTASVLARCHTWAALGRLPGDRATVEAPAVRFSARHQAMVVRPSTNDEDSGTALWRHFLAVSPSLLSGTQELNIALAGLGPSLFIYGAALHANVGETYSLHLLERAILASLRSSLTAETQAKLGLVNAAGLMIMSAAAVSGYRASFIRAVAEDALFVTESQIRLYPADAASLQTRKALIIARAGSMKFTGQASAAPVRAGAPVQDDDAVSVADTEMSAAAGGPTSTEAIDRYFAGMDGDGGVTPRPQTPVKAEDVDAIRRIASLAQQNHGLAASQVAPEGSMGGINF
jgi:hypothetical protein